MIISGLLTVSNPKMDDERRRIASFESEEHGFEVSHFDIKQTTTAPLGNHYHREKTETFLILEGSGTLVCCDVAEIDGAPTSMGNLERIALSKGTVVHVQSYTAHAFFLEESSVMVCWSSKPFDGKDMPTFKLI